MKDTGNLFRKSLQKQQEALQRFKDRKEAHLQQRQEIIRDIAAARAIWKETKSKLPDSGFDQ
jgi:hypothetical protein